MAEADWTFMNDGLSAGSVKRGATAGIARPSGGGNFVFGFNSIANTAGAVALYGNQVDFAPATKGGSVRAAMKRGAGGGPMNFAPFVFACAATNSVNGNAYMLGLDDDDPHAIVLRKGQLINGLPAVAIGTQGILARGNESFLNDTWHHLRLDVIVNTNGDVVLKAWKNDLDAHAVSAPVWTAVPGIDEFIDDALAINSGSDPLTSGYLGYGFQTKDVTRRAFFDYIEVIRQQ